MNSRFQPAEPVLHPAARLRYSQKRVASSFLIPKSLLIFFLLSAFSAVAALPTLSPYYEKEVKLPKNRFHPLHERPGVISTLKAPAAGGTRTLPPSRYPFTSLSPAARSSLEYLPSKMDTTASSPTTKIPFYHEKRDETAEPKDLLPEVRCLARKAISINHGPGETHEDEVLEFSTNGITPPTLAVGNKRVLNFGENYYNPYFDQSFHDPYDCGVPYDFYPSGYVPKGYDLTRDAYRSMTFWADLIREAQVYNWALQQYQVPSMHASDLLAYAWSDRDQWSWAIERHNAFITSHNDYIFNDRFCFSEITCIQYSEYSSVPWKESKDCGCHGSGDSCWPVCTCKPGTCICPYCKLHGHVELDFVPSEAIDYQSACCQQVPQRECVQQQPSPSPCSCASQVTLGSLSCSCLEELVSTTAALSQETAQPASPQATCPLEEYHAEIQVFSTAILEATSTYTVSMYHETPQPTAVTPEVDFLVEEYHAQIQAPSTVTLEAVPGYTVGNYYEMPHASTTVLEATCPLREHEIETHTISTTTSATETHSWTLSVYYEESYPSTVMLDLHTASSTLIEYHETLVPSHVVSTYYETSLLEGTTSRQYYEATVPPCTLSSCLEVPAPATSSFFAEYYQSPIPSTTESIYYETFLPETRITASVHSYEMAAPSCSVSSCLEVSVPVTSPFFVKQYEVAAPSCNDSAPCYEVSQPSSGNKAMSSANSGYLPYQTLAANVSDPYLTLSGERPLTQSCFNSSEGAEGYNFTSLNQSRACQNSSYNVSHPRLSFLDQRLPSSKDNGGHNIAWYRQSATATPVLQARNSQLSDRVDPMLLSTTYAEYLLAMASQINEAVSTSVDISMLASFFDPILRPEYSFPTKTKQTEDTKTIPTDVTEATLSIRTVMGFSGERRSVDLARSSLSQVTYGERPRHPTTSATIPAPKLTESARTVKDEVVNVHRYPSQMPQSLRDRVGKLNIVWPPEEPYTLEEWNTKPTSIPRVDRHIAKRQESAAEDVPKLTGRGLIIWTPAVIATTFALVPIILGITLVFTLLLYTGIKYIGETNVVLEERDSKPVKTRVDDVEIPETVVMSEPAAMEPALLPIRHNREIVSHQSPPDGVSESRSEQTIQPPNYEDLKVPWYRKVIAARPIQFIGPRPPMAQSNRDIMDPGLVLRLVSERLARDPPQTISTICGSIADENHPNRASQTVIVKTGVDSETDCGKETLKWRRKDRRDRWLSTLFTENVPGTESVGFAERLVQKDQAENTTDDKKASRHEEGIQPTIHTEYSQGVGVQARNLPISTSYAGARLETVIEDKKLHVSNTVVDDQLQTDRSKKPTSFELIPPTTSFLTTHQSQPAVHFSAYVDGEGPSEDGSTLDVSTAGRRWQAILEAGPALFEVKEDTEETMNSAFSPGSLTLTPPSLPSSLASNGTLKIRGEKVPDALAVMDNVSRLQSDSTGAPESPAILGNLDGK